MNPTANDEIGQLLQKAKTIAVVGLSNSPLRPSHGVSAYLQSHGYRIIPVNPLVSEVLGERSYGSLRDVPEKVDLVDIFRKSEDVPPIVDDAIAIGARAVWMQEGVVHQAAGDKAHAAGLKVVMDHCVLKEHARRAARKD